MIISFIGHSFVPNRAQMKKLVKEALVGTLRGNDSAVCYMGRHGDFDEICAEVCLEIKKEASKIERVYVMPYLNLSEQSKLNEMQKQGIYDSSIYPPIEKAPPRFAILRRNEWMMKSADVVIAYVNRPLGGAYKALLVARRHKKKIINLGSL